MTNAKILRGMVCIKYLAIYSTGAVLEGLSGHTLSVCGDHRTDCSVQVTALNHMTKIPDHVLYASVIRETILRTCKRIFLNDDLYFCIQ